MSIDVFTMLAGCLLVGSSLFESSLGSLASNTRVFGLRRCTGKNSLPLRTRSGGGGGFVRGGALPCNTLGDKTLPLVIGTRESSAFSSEFCRDELTLRLDTREIALERLLRP